MPQTKQDDMFYEIIDAFRDIYVCLSRKVAHENLTVAETTVFQIVSDRLAEYTNAPGALAEEIDRRLQDTKHHYLTFNQDNTPMGAA